MHLNVEHSTVYQYNQPLIYSIQQLKLTPSNGFGQNVKNWSISVNAQLDQYQDCFGNVVHTAVIDSHHEAIKIIAKGDVETGLNVIEAEGQLPLAIYLRQTDLTLVDMQLNDFSRQFGVLKSHEQLERLSEAVIAKVQYQRGASAVYTSAAQAFQNGAGVCQDHAHIFICCCRNLGAPARYVSGYLFTDDGHLIDSHAWADVWLADLGWVSVDVSNQCFADARYVRLAIGMDYHDACPVKGVRVGGGIETLQVGVKIWQLDGHVVHQQIQQ